MFVIVLYICYTTLESHLEIWVLFRPTRITPLFNEAVSLLLHPQPPIHLIYPHPLGILKVLELSPKFIQYLSIQVLGLSSSLKLIRSMNLVKNLVHLHLPITLLALSEKRLNRCGFLHIPRFWYFPHRLEVRNSTHFSRWLVSSKIICGSFSTNCMHMTD